MMFKISGIPLLPSASMVYRYFFFAKIPNQQVFEISNKYYDFISYQNEPWSSSKFIKIKWMSLDNNSDNC